MKDSEPDLARLDALAEQLDAGWDDVEDSMAPPALTSEAASEQPPTSIEAVDEAWESISQQVVAPGRVRSSRDRKKNKPAASRVPERAVASAPQRALSKKQRRELERKQRAHSSKQHNETKLQRKEKRREEARRAAERERLAREQARAERALEQQRREEARKAALALEPPKNKPVKRKAQVSAPVARANETKTSEPKSKKLNRHKAAAKKDKSLYAVPIAIVLAAIAIYFMTR